MATRGKGAGEPRPPKDKAGPNESVDGRAAAERVRSRGAEHLPRCPGPHQFPTPGDPWCQGCSVEIARDLLLASAAEAVMETFGEALRVAVKALHAGLPPAEDRVVLDSSERSTVSIAEAFIAEIQARATLHTVVEKTHGADPRTGEKMTFWSEVPALDHAPGPGNPERSAFVLGAARMLREAGWSVADVAWALYGARDARRVDRARKVISDATTRGDALSAMCKAGRRAAERASSAAESERACRPTGNVVALAPAPKATRAGEANRKEKRRARRVS